MKVDKLSISLDPDLGDEVRAAARKAGQSVSGWLAEAARARLRSTAFKELMDDWEREHGPFTEEELEQAHRHLYPEQYPEQNRSDAPGRRVAE